jgi:hypothetical protein
MLALCGCAEHYVFEKSRIVHDETLMERCLNSVEKMRAADCTMSHRVILEVWSEEYDFNGCLAVENGKILKGASYGDMGGKVFEFSYADGKAKISSMPDGIPEDALLEGMLGDINFLYAKPEYRRSSLVQQGVSHFDLVCYLTDDDMDVYMFREAQTMPDMGMAVRDSEIVMTVKYSEYQRDDKRGLCLPHKLEVTNYSWNYKTAIRLFNIKFKD